MDNALQATWAVEHDGAAGVAEPSLAWSYRFFGAAVLARDPSELPLGVRAILAWAASEARRMVSTGRASSDRELVLGLRLAYQTLKAEAAAVRAVVSEGEPRAPDALPVALARLRHRQRAAAVLRYGLGIDETGVGRVLGVAPRHVPAILAGASAAAAKAAARPFDLARSLRTAGRDPARPRRRAGSASSRPEPVNVVRLPRGVVRALLAPPQSLPADDVAPAPSRAFSSPVEVLLSSHVQPDTALIRQRERMLAETTLRPHVGRARGWSLLWRVAAAASVGVLFAWAVWPAYG